MNIAQARQIPLQSVAERLGGRFSHADARGGLWFHSPFRPDEKTASFKIDPKTNTWHDFARTSKHDAHGDILDLWADWHHLPRRGPGVVKETLQALRTAFGGNMLPPIRHRQTPPPSPPAPPRYKITKTGVLWDRGLKGEVARRRVDFAHAWRYLQQAHIRDTKAARSYTGFAFLNDKGGYEISIPNPRKGESFKTVIGPKAMTTVAGKNSRDICVFEGFWDALTYLTMNKGQTAIPALYVLNTVSMIGELTARLIREKNQIGNVFLFLDNDAAGEKATNALLDLLEPHRLAVGTKNHLYAEWKDLNEWYKGGQKLNADS